MTCRPAASKSEKRQARRHEERDARRRADRAERGKAPETATLRAYQRRIFWRLRDLARSGERDLGLTAPVGSGKTTICKALACDLLLETEHPAQFRAVLFSAPLGAICSSRSPTVFVSVAVRVQR